MGSIATDEVKSILMSIVERDDVDEKEKKSTLIDFVAAGVLTVGTQVDNVLLITAVENHGRSERWYDSSVVRADSWIAESPQCMSNEDAPFPCRHL